LIDLTRLSRTPTARKATDDARMMLKIQNLIEDLKCFETVRSRRWPDGVTCPHWASSQGITQGHDDTQPARQRDECSACQGRFDDLTGTIFAGHRPSVMPPGVGTFTSSRA
jgi:hypothetical protein